MTFDDPTVAQARTATDALRELERSGPLLADPATRRRWAVDLLDELAYLADAIPGAVEAASGADELDVTTLADELAEAIRRRRDDLGAAERTTGPALPAVGNADGPSSSRGPKHRARRHLRPVR